MRRFIAVGVLWLGATYSTSLLRHVCEKIIYFVLTALHFTLYFNWMNLSFVFCCFVFSNLMLLLC